MFRFPIPHDLFPQLDVYLSAEGTFLTDGDSQLLGL